MKKIYLVDSENVGDIWVPLLVSSQPEDELLVFYTQKSPHMNYENVRMLKETEKTATFIKCFEGSNALDFQLVTELGYRLQEKSDCEYVIVSNDTGFDAVVRYWSVRKMPVSRLSGKECARMVQGRKQQQPKKLGQSGQTLNLSELTLEQSEPEEEQLGAPAESAEAAEELPVVQVKPEQVEPEMEPEELAVESEQVKSEVEQMEPEQVKPEMEQMEPEQMEPEQMKPEVEQMEPEQVKPDVEQMESEVEPQIMNSPEVEGVELPEAQKQPLAEASESVRVSEGVDAPQETVAVEGIVRNLCHCIGKDSLAEFHNALIVFFGEDKGKELYQEIKSSPEWMGYWTEIPDCSQEEKFDIYCKMVFESGELAEECPEDFSTFLFKANGKRKNLNSLRAALQGHYGKDKGMKYYSLIKSHIKIMNRM